jgi:hypothetical protein
MIVSLFADYRGIKLQAGSAENNLKYNPTRAGLRMTLHKPVVENPEQQVMNFIGNILSE